MKILIVDDDENILDLLESFLKAQGHQVLRSSAAEEGQRLFFSEKPDILFLDIVLPQKDGIALLKEIKAKEPTATVVMMTGYKDAEKVVSAFREGAFDCLLKPINFDYLKNDILTRVPLRER